jgi:hypothetical protein
MSTAFGICCKKKLEANNFSSESESFNESICIFYAALLFNSFHKQLSELDSLFSIRHSLTFLIKLPSSRSFIIFKLQKWTRSSLPARLQSEGNRIMA